MKNPFDIFDRAYCIHLPQHTERLELVKKEFDKVGLTDRVQYISAKPPQGRFTMNNMRRNPKAEFGVSLSQMKVAVHAIADGATQPIFFEDDIVFDPNAKERLAAALQELPSDWEMLYMGGHPRGKHSTATRYSNTLAKVTKMSFADSYSIRGDLVIKWVDMWMDSVGREKDGMVDFILGDFSAMHNSYCVYPIICTQRVGHSYIGNKHDDKRDLIKRGWGHHLGKNA